MNRRGPLFPFVAAAAALMVASPLCAQSRLYVRDASDGQFHRVLAVTEDTPYIMLKAGLAPASDRLCVLRKADEFLPCFIAIGHKEVEVSGGNIMGEAASVDVSKKIHFTAELNSPYGLDDVFIVLELDFADGASSLVVHGVGRLEPRIPRQYSMESDLMRDSAMRQCRVHLFAKGSEVFTSEQPAALREEMIGRMIATRIAAVKQAGPSLLMGPAPGYPDALRKSGVKGRAVVAVRITVKGAVLDPSLVSATDPAFGEAALAAVQEWRFVPCVREGSPVEVKVNIPIGFDPSGPAAR